MSPPSQVGGITQIPLFYVLLWACGAEDPHTPLTIRIPSPLLLLDIRSTLHILEKSASMSHHASPGLLNSLFLYLIAFCTLCLP